jgi:hypothetical protein
MWHVEEMHVASRIDARVDPGEALPQGGGKIGVRGIEHVSVALSDDRARLLPILTAQQ